MIEITKREKLTTPHVYISDCLFFLKFNEDKYGSLINFFEYLFQF